MWLRQAFFRWLLPAALVLPIWLLVGWGVFQAGGWAFLWVLFIAVPSVLLGELLLALLVRARPSVRASHVVSWADVGGFGLWHALTIAVGLFPKDAFPWVLSGAIAAFLLLFWLSLRQLWGEARGSSPLPRMGSAQGGRAQGAEVPSSAPGRTSTGAGRAGDVIVVAETPRPDDMGPR